MFIVVYLSITIKFNILISSNNFVLIFKEQAIRSGGGKNYDSVSNNDRDGYGQPDGE